MRMPFAGSRLRRPQQPWELAKGFCVECLNDVNAFPMVYLGSHLQPSTWWVVLRRLVRLGLMKSAGRKSFVPDEYFRMTQQGQEMYVEEVRGNIRRLRRASRIAEFAQWLHSSSDREFADWRNRKRRGSRTYDAWLRSESGTFSEWIKEN